MILAQPPAESVTGDECLFCHRNTIGVSWQKNAHAQGLRGRTLRKIGYNKFAILDPKTNLWDDEKFGVSCARCHQPSPAGGIDCDACHGEVDLKHSGDTSLVLLSKKRHDSAKVVEAICAKCHVRDGHVSRNVRDVMEGGSDVTCVSCHRVRANSTSKHRLVLTSPACLDCHNARGPKKAVKKYEIHNPTCEY